MRKAISCHNALHSAVSLSFDEAKDPSSELYSNLQFPSTLTHVVPGCTRRTAIELHCLKERCEEEISLLTSEMERLVAFIHNQMKVLATEINKEVTADTNTLALGLKSLFLSKRAEFVKQLQTLKILWDDSVSIHLDQNEILTSYREFLDTNVPLEPDTSVENVGDCYLDSDSEHYSDY